jgi:hypothetical protein
MGTLFTLLFFLKPVNDLRKPRVVYRHSAAVRPTNLANIPDKIPLPILPLAKLAAGSDGGPD